MSTPTAQTIRLENKVKVDNATDTITFWVLWRDIPNPSAPYKFTNNNSGGFVNGQVGSFDLATASPPIPKGAYVWPTVRCDASGVEMSAEVPQYFQYSPNGETVTYRAWGGPDHFEVFIPTRWSPGS
jgi:hypothetical protein